MTKELGDYVPDSIKRQAKEINQPSLEEAPVPEVDIEEIGVEVVEQAQEVSNEQPEATDIKPSSLPVIKDKSKIQAMAGMVATYSQKLVGDNRAKQFVATLSLLVKQQPKLALCTTESLLASMMACVHLDIMPNTPAGLAYLIPYSDKAQFQMGYKGLCELAYRSGEVKAISAELVFPSDKFEITMGTDRAITHKPDLLIDRTIAKDALYVYATAKMKGGSTTFAILNRKDIEKVRKSVKARSTDTPWVQWEEEMWKKTAVKKLTKLLPMSSRDNRLVQAVEYDSWSQANKLSVVNGNLFENDQPKEKETKQIKDTTKSDLEGKIDGK
jgi:recombination protein RecT